MGSVTDVVADAWDTLSYGATKKLGLSDMIRGGEEISANGSSATQALTEEKEDALKKRKALYETSGGVLGQDVSAVGSSSRGSIFGNK